MKKNRFQKNFMQSTFVYAWVKKERKSKNRKEKKVKPILQKLNKQK